MKVINLKDKYKKELQIMAKQQNSFEIVQSQIDTWAKF